LLIVTQDICLALRQCNFLPPCRNLYRRVPDEKRDVVAGVSDL
jgi:hypothetical protein